MEPSAPATEATPLILSPDRITPPSSSSSSRPFKGSRIVTFNPHTTISSTTGTSSTAIQTSAPSPGIGTVGQVQPVLSALTSKLRRRGSYGGSAVPQPPVASKIGPQRTTKTTQKLKLLPNPDPGEDSPDEESGRDVYSQFTRIKDPTARRDAARLGKADRDKLPRVTAYCTANAYRLDGLMKFLKGRGRTRGAAPKLFDECIYTPYAYPQEKTYPPPSRSPVLHGKSKDQTRHERRHSDSALEVEDSKKHRREDLIDLQNEDQRSTGSRDSDLPASEEPPRENTPDFDTYIHTPEIFLFNYGTVVIWGMTPTDESRFLTELSKFETEKLAPDDVQTENFNFYYTRDYQARIYNDFISLREKKNYMTKLAISHALAQSVKTSLFEDLVDNTIETTKDIPERIALTGKVNLTRRQILMQVGELFILRINIHLQGSVLDSPELMWAEPQLDPVYQAVRSYLEMDQRVRLLTERLDVIADLLTVLKDQLTHSHGEYLEWIVIALIAAEIVVAAVNILVDLYAGVD